MLCEEREMIFFYFLQQNNTTTENIMSTDKQTNKQTPIMVDRPLFTPVAYTTTVYTEWNNDECVIIVEIEVYTLYTQTIPIDDV
jgi:hypothetical protein